MNCTSHCANCNQHFHSTVAFALHRFNGDCYEAEDDDRLFAYKNGTCQLQRGRYVPHEPGMRPAYPPGWQSGDPMMMRAVHGVTIWARK